MKAVLAAYLKAFPDETERLRSLDRFLQSATDPKLLFDRKNFGGHITASGFVLSPDGRKIAVVKHKFLDRYLQPGGHVEESDADLISAALREIREETEIESCLYIAFHADPAIPIDIDTHEIPANPRKGEPAHLHHDFRYLFRAEGEVAPAETPRDGTFWSWRPLNNAIEEPTFQFALRKLARIS